LVPKFHWKDSVLIHQDVGQYYFLQEPQPFWQQLFFGPIARHGMKIGILRLGTELADPMELDDSDASVAELRRSIRERLEVDEKMGVRLGVSVSFFIGRHWGED